MLWNKKKKVGNASLEDFRIVMLGHKRVPSREGGIEVVVQELAVRMAGRGIKVTCFNRGGHFVSGGKYDRSGIKSYQGVTLRTVPTIDLRGQAAVSASFSASLLAATGPYDIVHIHAEGPSLFIALLAAAGKKCVVTIHGLDWQRAKWSRFASKIILFGERAAVKHADAIIVLSRSAQDYFLKTYGRKTIFIPNGVSEPVRAEADLIKSHYAIDKDGYFLFVGRLVPEKGLKCLIEAYKGLKTDKKLLIAGGQSDAERFSHEIYKLAKGDDRIIFSGFVEGRMLEELFSNTYVYLIPSELEGMPLSLLEAMSYGNCCVTSDIRECTDITGKWGYSFPRGNVEALRGLMQDLCDHPEKVEAMRKGAADQVLSNYSWDETVDETLKVYSEVLSAK